MRIAIAIPARLAATRLPNKPLLDLGGAPLVIRTWQRAAAAQGVDDVYIATDSAEIEKVADAYGAKCVMTQASHQSGTDRIAELAKTVEADAWINVQADEPFVQPSDLERLAATLRDGVAPMCTLCVPCPAEDFENPHVVKVVRNDEGLALYFSRAPIPHGSTAPLRHLGIYGYTRDVLMKISAAPQNDLEKAERLEQLRALGLGIPIWVGDAQSQGIGIDTPEDLAKARELFSNNTQAPPPALQGAL